MSRIVIVILIYHRYKPIDLTLLSYVLWHRVVRENSDVSVEHIADKFRFEGWAKQETNRRRIRLLYMVLQGRSDHPENHAPISAAPYRKLSQTLKYKNNSRNIHENGTNFQQYRMRGTLIARNRKSSDCSLQVVAVWVLFCSLPFLDCWCLRIDSWEVHL
jgi:hypothetical protein